MTLLQKCIVNGCKTVQVAGNGGVTMSGKSCTPLAVNYRFQGTGTLRKKMTSCSSSRICMTHSEGPRAVFGSRMNLAILWREIPSIPAVY